MKRINDIFYSLQGEGHNSGRAAVFIRFAGCNLRCSFCDTDFDSYREMTDGQILEAIAVYPARFVVLTGGEPTLQVDEAFVGLLHDKGYEVAMESNGLRPAPSNIDWLTVSPKGCIPEHFLGKAKQRVRMPDEIKIVFEDETSFENLVKDLPLLLEEAVGMRPFLYIQPCDTGHQQRNALVVQACIDYVKRHPEWRLSLQTHKLVGFK